MCDGESTPVAAALVDHELAEEARGAAGRYFGGGDALVAGTQSRRLQLQMHVLLKGTNAGVQFRSTQLIGGHVDAEGGNSPISPFLSHTTNCSLRFSQSTRGYAMQADVLCVRQE